MKNMLVASMAVGAVLLLGGCSSGGGSSSSDDDDNLDLGTPGPAQPGIYRGEFTLKDQKAERTIMLLAPDGGFTLYNGSYISGDMNFSGDSFTGEFDQYGGIDKQWQAGFVDGASNTKSISGAARAQEGGAEGANFDFIRDAGISSYKGSAADLAGMWSDGRDGENITTLNIGADGVVIDGSTTGGCVITGAFDETNPAVNIYKTALTNANCTDASQNGLYEGYAHFDPSNGNLVLLDDNGQNDNDVPFRRFVFTPQ